MENNQPVSLQEVNEMRSNQHDVDSDQVYTSLSLFERLPQELVWNIFEYAPHMVEYLRLVSTWTRYMLKL